ncbi:MAG: nuclear transport factor 2 family protein [Cyclobacteriaceae bacterium]
MYYTLVILTTLFLTSPWQDEKASLIMRSNELDSLITRHDVAAAGRIYADEFVLTGSTGKHKSKADMLKDIANDKIVWEINHTSDIGVRLIGETGVLTGVLHQKGRIQDKDFDVRLAVTDTWVLKDGVWILLAGHATILPKP